MNLNTLGERTVIFVSHLVQERDRVLLIHLSSFNQLQRIELYALMESMEIYDFSISNTPQILKMGNSGLKFIDELANMIDPSENFHFYIFIETDSDWAKEIDANTYEGVQNRIVSDIKIHMPCMNAKSILHVQFLEISVPWDPWDESRWDRIHQHIQELEDMQQ